MLMITLNDKIYWDYTSFDYDYFGGDETPLIDLSWDIYPNLDNYSPSKGIELRNIILRSGITFNLENCGLELTTNFILKGDACCWIFTRSNIDISEENDINSNIVYSKEELNKQALLNKYSSIIKISKEDKTQKCFISMGTFINDDCGRRIYKTFLRRQLINSSSNFYLFKNLEIKNKVNIENDVSYFKVQVMDAGLEKISLNILLNDSIEHDIIEGNFYLPVKKKSRIMIAGSGQSCIVNTLICKPFVKDFLYPDFGAERKNCDCCLLI